MKHKAIFLDRDGTIIQQVDELTKPRQIQLLPKVADAIKSFNEIGYLCIVITNQPIIGKGLISKQEMAALNKILREKLATLGARLEAIYVCLHKYPSTCSCRKPAIGLIKQAQKKFNIDLKKSFMIGDSTRDVMTGQNAGLKTILVKTGDYGHDGRDSKFFDVEADYTVENLWASVKIVKNIKPL